MRRGQVGTEYIAAFTLWVMVCVIISYTLSSYSLSLKESRDTNARNTILGHFFSLADDATEPSTKISGIFLEDYNITFFGNIGSLSSRNKTTLGYTTANFTYSDTIGRGDTFLIKNVNGTFLLIKEE
ncbi:MAG: hypothetical protein QXP42_00955 [Candidatus Micrarchaeia archaeon]